MEMTGQLQAPPASSPGKILRYLLDRRRSGPQSRSGLGNENIKIAAPAGIARQTIPEKSKYFNGGKYTQTLFHHDNEMLSLPLLPWATHLQHFTSNLELIYQILNCTHKEH
jgi:hypothetical protein